MLTVLSDLNQLSRIFGIMGRPPADDLYRLPAKQQDYIRNFLPSNKKTPWDKVFEPKLMEMDRDYIMEMLAWTEADNPQATGDSIKQTATTLAPLMPRYDERAAYDLRKRYGNDLNNFRREFSSPQNRNDQRIARWAEEADFFWRLHLFNQHHKKEYDDFLKEKQEFFSTFPLLDSLLTFNPQKRPTAAGALADPWLAGYHSPEDEPVPSEPLPPTIFWFEKDKNDINGPDFRGKTFRDSHSYIGC